MPARLVRSVVTYPPIRCVDQALLLRALEVYETERIYFAEAYLAASAEAAGVPGVVSFDRDLDRVPAITRFQP